MLTMNDVTCTNELCMTLPVLVVHLPLIAVATQSVGKLTGCGMVMVHILTMIFLLRL